MTSIASAHPNIALVKYWGKSNDETNDPIHGSLSVTLDFGTTTTESHFSDENSLILNGKPSPITNRLLRAIEIFNDGQRRSFSIVSSNDFPTAAGFASSAAGSAAFVTSIAGLVGETDKPIEFFAERNLDLTRVAQFVSGSGCRSMFGGFVEWNQSENLPFHSFQVFPESHWPELCCLSLCLESGKKDVSSTKGMKKCVQTVPWINWRANEVVPSRISSIKSYISSKSFSEMSDIIMKESNELHADCAAAYPPLHYLKDSSYSVIDHIHSLNNEAKRNIAAYSFDAGPNPFIFCLDEDLSRVQSSLIDSELVSASQIRLTHPAGGPTCVFSS